MGMRPPDVQYSTSSSAPADQVANQVAKMRYMSGESHGAHGHARRWGYGPGPSTPR
jgi:pyruvate/2-oxoglutarate/acetoin dehydrogenase E1 component